MRGRASLRERPALEARDRTAPKSDDARDCVPLWLLDNHNGTQNAKPATRSQLQPLVLPQDGQAWHEPARCICTPHCMQYGASTLVVGRLMAGD